MLTLRLHPPAWALALMVLLLLGLSAADADAADRTTGSTQDVRSAWTVDRDRDGRVDEVRLTLRHPARGGPRDPLVRRLAIAGISRRDVRVSARSGSRTVGLLLPGSRRPAGSWRPRVVVPDSGGRTAAVLARAHDRVAPLLESAVFVADEHRPVRTRWSEPVLVPTAPGGTWRGRDHDDGIVRLQARKQRRSSRDVAVDVRSGHAPAIAWLRYSAAKRSAVRDRAGNHARPALVRVGRQAPEVPEVPTPDVPMPDVPLPQVPVTEPVPSPVPAPVPPPVPVPAPTPAPAEDTSVPAVIPRPADALADSVGVNVHVHYLDTAYGQYTGWADKLQSAGVRAVRDGLVANHPTQYARMRDLAARGIDINLIMGDPQGRYGTGPLEGLVETLKRELPGAVTSVEGPNEYDISGDSNWVSAVREYQQRLHRLIKGDPATAGLEVLAPSFVYGNSPGLVGDLSAWVDMGNMHPYPGGRQPSSNIATELARAASVSHTKPVVATETGYHNALAATSGQPPVSERAAASYMVKLYLEYFRMGVPRTYAYELVDQRPDAERREPEHNFGLLRSDLSEKPAFGALRNLLSLVRAPGPASSPTGLRYVLEGDTAGVRSMPLQRRDGSFVLAVWADPALWNTSTRTDLVPAPRSVTVRLGTPIAEANVFSPVESSAPMASLDRPTRVPLTLREGPLLVELRPSAG